MIWCLLDDVMKTMETVLVVSLSVAVRSEFALKVRNRLMPHVYVAL